MRARSKEFATAQVDPRQAPLITVSLWTPSGVRVFCAEGMTDNEVWSQSNNRLDGSWKLDGSRQWGAQLFPVVSVKPIVDRYGDIRDTGSILPTVAIRTKRMREAGNVQIDLKNDEDYCGLMMAQDVLLGALLNFTVSYRGLRRDKAVTRFQGVIQELVLTRETLTIRAETA